MSKAEISDEAKVVVYFEAAPLETATMILGVCSGILKRRNAGSNNAEGVDTMKAPVKRRQRRKRLVPEAVAGELAAMGKAGD